MAQQKFRATAIVLGIALSQAILKYSASGLYDLAGLPDAQFPWEMMNAGADALTAVIGMVIFRIYCPQIYEQSKQKLDAIRKSTFVSNSRLNKMTLISAACIGFMGASSFVLNKSQDRIGYKVEFAPTKEYLNGISNSDASNPNDMSWKIAISKKLVGRAAAAFGEELVYRWLFAGILIGMVAEWPAILISSLVFGLSHAVARLHYPSFFENILLVVPAMISGLGFGFGYVRSGLALSFVLHLIGNSTAAFRGHWIGNLGLAFCLLVLAATPFVLLSTAIKKMRRH